MDNSVTVNVQLKLNRKGNPFLTEELMLHWISVALNVNANHVEALVKKLETAVIVIEVNGGLISKLKADAPARVIVLDGDTQDSSEDLLVVDGEQFVVSNYDPVHIDKIHVMSVIDQIEAPAA